MFRKSFLSIIAGLFLFSQVVFGEANPQPAPKPEQTQVEQTSVDYQADIGQIVIREAEKLGLVNLALYLDTIQVKNFGFAHPAFIYMFGKLTKAGYNAHRITEGWPVTVKHISRSHFTGRSIDVTVKDPSKASEICNFINNLKDFSCVNEYKKMYKHSTGKHLHLSYSGK